MLKDYPFLHDEVPPELDDVLAEDVRPGIR